MAARGRGRGRGLLAVNVKAHLTPEPGPGGDGSALKTIQNDITSGSSNATSQAKPITPTSSYESSSSPTSSTPPTHGSFTSSSFTAPQASTFMSARTSMSGKVSSPLSSPSIPSSQPEASPAYPEPAAEQRNPARNSSSATTTTTTSAAAAAARPSGGFADLEQKLERLSMYENDFRDAMEVVQVMEALMSSSDDVKRATEMLYQRCVADVYAAKSGAIVCNSLASVEVGGTKFRSCILGYLQKDFEEKDNLRKESLSRFLGFFSFLCQVFGEMRTATGEHFRPLIAPIFNCVDLMLGVSEGKVQAKSRDNADEIECILLQFQSVGKELENLDSDRMSKTMEAVRMKIINNGTSPQIRCVLLEMIECYGRRFEQAPNEVTRFYCDTMAEILAGLIV